MTTRKEWYNNMIIDLIEIGFCLKKKSTTYISIKLFLFVYKTKLSTFSSEKSSSYMYKNVFFFLFIYTDLLLQIV